MSNLKGKQVLIRADASPCIGTGHIMRSHVLARALVKAGAVVTFASRETSGHMFEFIRTQGYNLHTMPLHQGWHYEQSDSLTWLGALVKTDIQETFSQNYDVVVVDHYGANAQWFECARSHSQCIVSIDDEATRKMLCDIVINQNYFPEKNGLYQNLVPETAQLLIGPEYALLREEFERARPQAKMRTDLKKLLILMGGNDTFGVSERILENLSLGLDVTIVAGRNPSDRLKKICKTDGHTLIKATDKIADLILEADFCIGAGGSTSWERCCLMLPSALFVLAKNQQKIVENLAQAGVCVSLGRPDEFDFERIDEILKPFINQPQNLKAMSKDAGALVNGLGVHRVVKQIQTCFE